MTLRHRNREERENGLERGRISKAILEALRIRNDESKEGWNKRWEAVWNDGICRKYKKNDSDNMFLWAIEFFNAPLFDLHHIARLVGAKL